MVSFYNFFFIFRNSPSILPTCTTRKTFQTKAVANQAVLHFSIPIHSKLQALLITLRLRMVVLFMPHCQPFLHELFSPFGVDADAHWIAGRRGVVAENSPYLVKQSDSRIQEILRWRPHRMRGWGRSIFGYKHRICRSLRRRFFVLKAQTLRFLNEGVLDGSEFFLL